MIQGVELVTDRAAKTAAARETAESRTVPSSWGCWSLLRGHVQQRAGDHAAADHDPEMQVDEGVSILDQAFTDVAAGQVPDDAIALRRLVSMAITTPLPTQVPARRYWPR
ncbi:MAG: hypothetical protein R2854_16605 [Caldilineaceae bacterium]